MLRKKIADALDERDAKVAREAIVIVSDAAADAIEAEIERSRLGNGYVPAGNFKKIARRLREAAADAAS